MGDQQRQAVQSGPRRSARARARLAIAVAVVTSFVAALNLLPARAQQAAPAPTPVTITLNALAASGQSVTNLSLGPQTLNVVITNNAPATLSSQQVVVRVPPAPSYIASASDGTTNAGVIDNRTGVWYHTIPQIAGGGTLTITVSWQALCPGLWPLVARVGDKVSAVKGIWVGSPNSACTPDDSALPQPVSYYALPWPPTAASTATTTPGATASVATSAPASGATSTIAPTTSFAGATTLPIPATTGTPVSGGPPATLISLGTTTTVLVTPVQPGAPTTNPTSPTTPTTDGLTSLGSAKTTTTKKKATTRTTLIICKTIQGKRYCGASSSVYTAGQPKAKEISPKTAATKKK